MPTPAQAKTRKKQVRYRRLCPQHVWYIEQRKDQVAGNDIAICNDPTRVRRLVGGTERRADYRTKPPSDLRQVDYKARVSIAAGIFLFLATVLFMEGVAYVAHRWVMHGPGWFLHESHHRLRTGLFELNDLYALIFAIPSIILLLGGVQLGWGDWATWVGAGIAAYGAIYFGFHDVIVHQRIAHRYVARSAYMKRIVQAHRLHHATTGKYGSVSFGFLWAPPAATLKQQLASNEEALIRAPRG